jgi:internalin A
MVQRRSGRSRSGEAEALARIGKARREGATSLDLSGLGLAALPDAIGQLAQLQTLAVSDNQLTALPDAIGQFAQLQMLAVWGNQLTALPDAIGQFAQLQMLAVSGNQLTALPDAIGQLAQLEVLYADDNQLTALPDALSKLGSLRAFYLHGNDGLHLPPEVLGPTWRESGREKPAAKPTDILDYYFRVRAQQGRRPLNEAKLILVGRGAVGKTSLVNRLALNRFNRDEKKTEGISITNWPLELGGKEKVRLNIWDFGGQEIMHATHQFFLTQRSLYVLVLNGREGGEDTDADYWLKLIESFGGDSPVIVVLNKIKEHPFDLNRRALQQKYPFIRDFVRTDCEDGTGIAELRKVVERETDRLEHLRDDFPVSWFAVKDALAAMKDNFLTFDQYRAFCAQHGEAEPPAQDALAGHLHNLGVVLNFKDDPRLQDTHVLNPHWVTGGIYKVLNSDRVERQRGEIRLQDAAAVLDARDYPAAMRRFIFDLMRKFELCFTFPDDETRYLVPELLDKQEPEETAQWQREECLNFAYHYPVLPEGILPRFIVRTHALSEGQPRWRTGVVVRFDGCRALVKADVQDRKVSISVAGPAQDRRRLLAVVRAHFEEIHHGIPRLQPQAMVPLPGFPDEAVTYEELLGFERDGERELKRFVKGKVVTLPVSELLDGVDLEGARRAAAPEGDRDGGDAVRLFYSYSHIDEVLLEELKAHVTQLERVGLLKTWDDQRIGAGKELETEIDPRLEEADIILLLVSSDYLVSTPCQKEMRRALARHERGEARVVPVIVRDVDWKLAPFAKLKLKLLPKDARPVTNPAFWANHDIAWRNVEKGLKEVVEELRAQRGTLPRDRRSR